jgi:hypothetical protein
MDNALLWNTCRSPHYRKNLEISSQSDLIYSSDGKNKKMAPDFIFFYTMGQLCLRGIFDDIAVDVEFWVHMAP